MISSDMVPLTFLLFYVTFQVLKTADLKGAAVRDELAVRCGCCWRIFSSATTYRSDVVFDNASVRGEFEVTDKGDANFIQLLSYGKRVAVQNRQRYI